MKLLVTGATGFVGMALLRRLVAESRGTVRAAVRRAEPAGLPATVEVIAVGEQSGDTDWGEALRGVDVVVALAARVHNMRDSGPEQMAAYRSVNAGGTLRLARQAAASGVRRLVFLSSVKVNGEDGRFVESDPTSTTDAYGASKVEAEEGLRALAARGRMDVVIIRPPLVYGPGVRANFRSLMLAVKRGLPLPLGAVKNRRSLVAVDNLVDLIITCLAHPAAANETFFVSDGEDLSTPELVRRLAGAMGRPARLISVPTPLLVFGATLLGRRDLARRVLGSLQVDITKARRLLGWTPPVGVDEALRRAVGVQT